MDEVISCLKCGGESKTGEGSSLAGCVGVYLGVDCLLMSTGQAHNLGRHRTRLRFLLVKSTFRRPTNALVPTCLNCVGK